MSLIKRGEIWYYDFQKNGKRHQGSTGCTNKNDARQVEAKLRTDAALQRFGIGPAKPSPTLREFLEGTFTRHCEQHLKKPNTVRFYREKTQRLLEWTIWRETRLSDMTGELIEQYKQSRTRLTNDSINAELATLRKALKLAEEWKLAPRIKVRLLPPSKNREFVLDGDFENQYLAAAKYPLKQVATLSLDLGTRPGECCAIAKSEIRDGSVYIPFGKTRNATRAIPLTERAKATIAQLTAMFPSSPWLFPGRNGKPITRGSVTNAHIQLRKKMGWSKEFVLYSSRHSFGTRLAESSGGNAFEIKALMGHASVTTSQKYVHPQSEQLTLAMKRAELLGKIMRGEVVPENSLQTFGTNRKDNEMS